VERIRTILPDVSISSDFITGFCGETEEDHEDTLKLVEAVGYDMAYMFAYSMRERTHAHRNYADDVPESVKQRRLSELIATFRRTTTPRFESQLGSTQLVLVEGPNKRAPETELIGKSDKGHKVVFPRTPVPDSLHTGEDSGFEETCEITNRDRCSHVMVNLEPGDFVEVYITGTTVASLRGEPLLRTNLTQFHKKYH
jgi:tRNA A37 methylthiotransferase MiaB